MHIVRTEFKVALVLSRETKSARTGPWNAYGTRKAIQMIITSVAASTMRPTSCVRSG